MIIKKIKSTDSKSNASDVDGRLAGGSGFVMSIDFISVTDGSVFFLIGVRRVETIFVNHKHEQRAKKFTGRLLVVES